MLLLSLSRREIHLHVPYRLILMRIGTSAVSIQPFMIVRLLLDKRIHALTYLPNESCSREQKVRCRAAIAFAPRLHLTQTNL